MVVTVQLPPWGGVNWKTEPLPLNNPQADRFQNRSRWDANLNYSDAEAAENADEELTKDSFASYQGMPLEFAENSLAPKF